MHIISSMFQVQHQRNTVQTVYVFKINRKYLSNLGENPNRKRLGWKIVWSVENCKHINPHAH